MKLMGEESEEFYRKLYKPAVEEMIKNREKLKLSRPRKDCKINNSVNISLPSNGKDFD